MKLSKILIDYRRNNNISARAFAKKAGLSNAYISLIENESTKSPTLDAMSKLAIAMDMDVNDLIDMLEDIEVKVRAKPVSKEIFIPLYDRILQSYPYLTEDEIVEYVPFSGSFLSPDKEHFAIHANDPGLIGRHINKGDLVIFEKTDKIDDGDLGLFFISDIGSIICKYTEQQNKFILLTPISDDYGVIVSEKGKEDYTLLGVYELSIVLADIT